MLFAKNQFSIPRGVIKKCELCTKQFGLFLRQHLCKRCFRIVCSDCSKTKRPVYKIGFTKVNHRLCKICKDHSDFTISFIKTKNLQFGSMSMLANRWLSKIKKPRIVGMTNQKQNKFTKQCFQQLWNSYSYEFRQYMGLLTFEYQQQSIYSMINNVFRTVIAVQSDEQISNVVYLVVTLLGFSSADKAMILVLAILEMKNQIKNIKQTVLNILKEYPMHSQLLRMEKYITYRFQKHFLSFMVNGLTFQSLLHILSKTFQKGNLQQVFYFFCSHIFTNRELLVNSHNNNELCDIYMLRFCSRQLVCQNYKYIKNKNLIEYIDQRSTKSEIILPESFQHMRKTQNSLTSRIFEAQLQSVKQQKGLIKRQISKQEQPSFQQSFSQIDMDSVDDSIEIFSYNDNTNVIANLVDLIPSQLKIRSISNEESDKILQRLKKELELKQQRIAELQQQKKTMRLQNIPTVQYVTIINDLKKKEKSLQQTVSNEEYQQILKQINDEKDMRMRYEQQLNKMNELLLEMNSKIEADRIKLEEKEQQNISRLVQINQLEIQLKNIKEQFNQSWKKKIEKEEKNIQILEGKISMNQTNFESNLGSMKEERDNYKLECVAKTVQIKEYKNIIAQNNEKITHFKKKLLSVQNQMSQKLKLISQMKTQNQNLSSAIDERTLKQKQFSKVKNISLMFNTKKLVKSHITIQSIYSIQISPKVKSPSSNFTILFTLQQIIRPNMPVQKINPESNSPKNLFFSLNNISYSFQSFSAPTTKLEQKQQIIGQLRLQIEQLTQNIAQNQAELTNIEILTSSSKSNKFSFNDLKSRLSQIQVQLNDKNNQILQLNNVIKNLNIQIDKMKISNKSLITKLEEMSELMMRFQAENMEIRDQIFELNQALQHKPLRTN